MDDVSLRLTLLKLAEHMLGLAEEQSKIRASVGVLKLAVMHLKGVPESQMREFLDSLSDAEARLALPSSNDQTIQQLRAIIERLESGHNAAILDS